MPAHVTLLYPFAHPTTLDDDKLRRVGDSFRAVPRFDFSLDAVAWFGDQVLYLVPDLRSRSDA